MQIIILIPVSINSTRGNQITGTRWAEMLSRMGHDVQIHDRASLPANVDADWVIALHACRSHAAITSLKSNMDSDQRPEKTRLAICMSGTDLHRDFDPQALASDDQTAKENYRNTIEVWEAVEAIILLEPQGMQRIPAKFHDKCTVIYQSATPVVDAADTPSDSSDCFRVTVIGHLRPIKDPFRAALAAKQLPTESRIRIDQYGAALNEEMSRMATQQTADNPRYHWHGEVTHEQAMIQLASSDLMVLSSINEGAPSVISESIVNDVPIVASRIDATIGLLGDDFPGFFEVGDTAGLAIILARAESEPEFLEQLRSAGAKRKPLFTAKREADSLRDLLDSRRN